VRRETVFPLNHTELNVLTMFLTIPLPPECHHKIVILPGVAGAFIKVTRKTIGYYTFLFHRVIVGERFCVLSAAKTWLFKQGLQYGSHCLSSVCRGVVPFSQRKKMLEKARAKNKKPKSSAGISSIPNITVGTQVRQSFTRACCCLACER